MFAQRIPETAFTKPFAEEYFSKIGGDEVCDAALTSVLRAILWDRAERLRIDFRQYEANDATVEDVNEGCVNHDEDTLSITDIRYAGKFSDEAIAKFAELNEGWERIEKVSKFYAHDFQVLCFVNKEKRNTILLVEALNVPKIHYMTASSICWFPWYFNLSDKATIPKRVMELLYTFREQRPDKFLDKIKEFEKDHDFYSMSLSVLDNFENRWRESELDALGNEIEDIDRMILDLYERITNKLREKEDKNIRLTGLKMGTDENSHEILDFLRENPNRIRYISSSESTLRFEVLTTCMYYDMDEAEKWVNNKRSLLYTKQRGKISAEDMAALFKAVFVDQQIAFRFTAQYELRIRDMRISGISHAEYSDAAQDFFPNIHIERHRCLGGYEQAMCQAMEAHNYIGAIEQCVVSAASLNFFDSTVMQGVLEELYGTNIEKKRCFVLPDGTAATIKEAIKFVKGGSKDEKKREKKEGEENE